MRQRESDPSIVLFGSDRFPRVRREISALPLGEINDANHHDVPAAPTKNLDLPCGISREMRKFARARALERQSHTGRGAGKAGKPSASARNLMRQRLFVTYGHRVGFQHSVMLISLPFEKRNRSLEPRIGIAAALFVPAPSADILIYCRYSSFESKCTSIQVQTSYLI